VRRSWPTLSALLLVVLASGTVRAQRGVDVELFRPSLDPNGIFSVERADTMKAWELGFKLSANLAGNPLRLVFTDPTDAMHQASTKQVVMSRQIGMDLGLSLGLTSWLELAVDVGLSAESYTSVYGSYGSPADPMIGRTGFYAADRFTNIPPPDAAPLDTRLALKARLFRKGAFGLAAAAILTAPFGDDKAFLGDTNYTFRPVLIADLTRGPITVAVNLGAILRQETRVFDPFDQAAGLPNPRLLLDVGHELTWSVGLAYHFVHWMGVGAEAFGLVPLVGMHKDYTADVLGGLQVYPLRNMVIQAGAGAGVISQAARHDDYRVFFGLTWVPQDPARASSAVGGLDSDGDGVPDGEDVCPNEPEDKDGFDDEDGCPDLDNDQDGLPDRKDRCPDEPEDRDGYQDDDGCPDPDNDGDGIPDAQDKCPNEPEDRDGFQDDDGCPDADNDGDGIPDAADKCPNDPETRNGIDDDDGCPDSGRGVQITQSGQIELPEAIGFEAGSIKLSAKALQVMERVADKLKGNPQVKRIRIEGHADDPGSPKQQAELAQKRAEAVREVLMKRGVDPERLQAVGYGNSRPLDKRRTSDARAINRRVELIIVEQRP
jgi:outer membrane protein OmpA-like peptidoglycan-associated protein